MKELLAKIGAKHKVFCGKGVSENDIAKAENKLGVSFPLEYKEFLREIGILSFSSHEFMGLGVDGHLNVVTSTLEERKLDTSFPKDCFLVENIGIEGILVLQDSKGSVYSYINKKKKKIANSFKDYILNDLLA